MSSFNPPIGELLFLGDFERDLEYRSIQTTQQVPYMTFHYA